MEEKIITSEQWEVLSKFRTGIEAEYSKSVVGKLERLPAYTETITVLRDAVDRYGIDQTDEEQVYCLISGIVASLSFVSQYMAMVCPDPHPLGHVAEAGTFLG